MHDLCIIGAGFGGLGMALRAAELGLRVVVLEALNYPGGCASTHTRRGAAFESGATLFSGLGPDGHFTRVLAAHGLEVPVEWLDPVLHVRAPDLVFDVPRDRAAFVRAAAALHPELAREISAFFTAQQKLADPLWRLFADPSLLPPFGTRALLTHAARVPQYLPLVPWLGRPLADLLEAHGLAGAHRLRHYLDALCQISVQTTCRDAETPFALATLDYPFRGTGHVKGGIGTLARALVQAIEHAGGTVQFTSRVDRVERTAGGIFRIHGRRGVTEAARLGCNLLPSAVTKLCGEHAILRELDAAVQTGWGAVMQYRRVRSEGLMAEGAHHVDLTHDPAVPLQDGNHVFCSVGDPDADGLRSVTVSTHVDGRAYLAADRAAFATRVQRTMNATVESMYPALASATVREAPGSPRTFERFVGRAFVGGIPRRAGLHHYRQLWPTQFMPRAWLVGDTVFPGQSTLATALGGAKAAEAAARS